MNLTNTANPNGVYTTSFEIAAGETVAQAVTIANLNLTGYTLKMQINFPTPLALNTGNGGITVTNATQGMFQINILDSASATLPIGAFPYDLFMVSGGGTSTRLLTGTFTVDQAIAVIP